MQIPFVEAANYTRVDPAKPRRIDLIVIHSMEAPEKGDTAESVARYFQRESVKASAHYCIDSNSIVQCVHDEDVAWAAPGGNHQGLHVEHAGFAKQTDKEWRDEYGMSMLRLSAALVAERCVEYNVPPIWRDQSDLKQGGALARGITSHANITLAFKKGTHTDPGSGFPIVMYCDMVIAAIAALRSGLTQLQKDQGITALRVLYGLPLPKETVALLNRIRADFN